MMGIFYNKIRVLVDLSVLRRNYRLLAAKGSRVLSVVKSDAYGHGLAEVSRALAAEGCRDFAVGTVDEALTLRGSGCAGRILSLLGPVDEPEFEALFAPSSAAGEGAPLVPFLGDFDQIAHLAQVARRMEGTAQVCLKLDTGMSRLGFTTDQVPAALDLLRAIPNVRVALTASHLATADEPSQAAYVAEQARAFAASLALVRAVYPGAEATLANSGAILAHPDTHHDLQRAGIALYGINPFRGTAWEAKGAGLSPAMSVTAPVVAVHPVAAGRTVSYGRTFTAPRDMRVAVVAAGYADGYSRGLSGKGAMCLGGARRPILGRVCMQLTAVDVTDGPAVKVGDRAFLLGGDGTNGAGPGAVSPEDLAGWWGTITYEAFCVLGLNNREFIN
jgi:alanine racemase